MRHDNDVGLGGGVVNFGLQHGVDGDVMVGEDAGDVGEDARAVLCGEAQVVTRADR